MKNLIILMLLLISVKAVSQNCVTGGYDWRGDKLAETVWIDLLMQTVTELTK